MGLTDVKSCRPTGIPKSAFSDSFPMHPFSAYASVVCHKNTDPQRAPWATNMIAGTGLSHTHAEYNAQANEDFRHYLKKAYRKLGIKSNLSECTDRSHDSDPDIPDYTKKRHLALKLQKKPKLDRPSTPIPSKESLIPEGRIGRRKGAASDHHKSTILISDGTNDVIKPVVRIVPVLPAEELTPRKTPRPVSFPMPVRDTSVVCSFFMNIYYEELCTSVWLVNKIITQNSYWPRKVAELKRDRKGRQRFRPPRTSLCATWSEEKSATKRKTGKAFLGTDTRSMVDVQGFDAIVPKPLRRGWSRESINMVVKATERQLMRSNKLREKSLLTNSVH